MNKKIASILLSLGLIVSFTACNTTTSTTKNSTINSTHATETEIVITTEVSTSEIETVESTADTSETETTVQNENVGTIETQNDGKTYYNYGLIFPIEPAEIPADATYIDVNDLKAVDETGYFKKHNEDNLTEGPIMYQYGYADLVVHYSGSDKFPKGVLVIQNIRVILDNTLIPNTDEKGVYWRIDDDWITHLAIQKFCTDNNIKESALGWYTHNMTIQNIHDKYWSSLRYNTQGTRNVHKQDGDVY